MLNCRQVSELCSRELDERLALKHRLSMRVHLMMCSGCSNYRRQLFTLHDAARRHARGEAPAAAADPNAMR